MTQDQILSIVKFKVKSNSLLLFKKDTNLFHNFLKNHLRHVRLKLRQRGNFIYAKFLSEDRIVVFAYLEYLLIRHNLTLLDKEGRGDEIELRFINTPLEREVTYNRHITDDSVKLC